jgi:hypothetical protein
MDISQRWGCPVCAEWIPSLDVLNHPCIAYESPRVPNRLSFLRRCERCQEFRLMLKMIHVKRPLGGRPYWTCRSCRP